MNQSNHSPYRIHIATSRDDLDQNATPTGDQLNSLLEAPKNLSAPSLKKNVRTCSEHLRDCAPEN